MHGLSDDPAAGRHGLVARTWEAELEVLFRRCGPSVMGRWSLHDANRAIQGMSSYFMGVQNGSRNISLASLAGSGLEYAWAFGRPGQGLTNVICPEVGCQLLVCIAGGCAVGIPIVLDRLIFLVILCCAHLQYHNPLFSQLQAYCCRDGLPQALVPGCLARQAAPESLCITMTGLGILDC